MPRPDAGNAVDGVAGGGGTALGEALGHGVHGGVEGVGRAGKLLVQALDLNGLGTDKPSFELVKSITAPQGGIHDINRVDDNTITVAGSKAYLFNVETEQFTEMSLFSGSTALKSLNYNAETGEVWYTDATIPEGDESWSSHKIRYSRNTSASAPGPAELSQISSEAFSR